MKNSTETLVTCPTCGTPNFTARGLKAHRCKGAKTSALSLHPSSFSSSAPGGRNGDAQLQPATVAPGNLSEDAVMGAQLTEQYGKAVGAMTEVLKFGAMMMMLRERLSVLTPRAESKRGSGRYASGTGLKAWLKEHAPAVKESTAFRFMNVALAVSEKFALPKKASFIDVATTPAADLSKALQKKQLELWDFVNGTSQRSWLDQFTPKGGSRERPNGTKRRTRDEKKFDDAHAMALEWYELGIVSLKENYLSADAHWLVLPEVELANVADLVKLWSKKLDDACRARKVVPSKLRDWDKDLNMDLYKEKI
jgi:hypothetical protein